MSAVKSKKDKLEYIALLEEKRKRLRAAKPLYTPTEGQYKVLSCKSLNIFNFSGNAAGKTALNAQFAMAMAKGYNPWSGESYRVPATIAFIVDTSRKIDARMVPEFKKWFDIKDEQLHKDGRPFTSRISLDNGSEIQFLTADADPASFEGTEFSNCVVDEPLPRQLYIALKRSLRKKGHPCRFVFSGTAISEAYLRREIYEPWKKGELADTTCFNMKTSDNEANLATGYIENFSRSLSEAEKAVRLNGGFFDTDTLALAEYFDPTIHIVKRDAFQYDPRMPCVVSIDPHTSKPSTAVMLCVDRDDKTIAIKEMALKANATQFAAALKEFEKGYNIQDRVCDSAANAAMSSGEGMHSFYTGLVNNGVMISTTTFLEKSHSDLIERLREGLTVPAPDQFGKSVPALRIHENCPKLISDIESVGWQKNRATGEIVMKLDTSIKDYLSCLGYGLARSIKYDIEKHSRPHYYSQKLPEDSSKRLEVERNRAIIKTERQARKRSRFFRRITRS